MYLGNDGFGIALSSLKDFFALLPYADQLVSQVLKLFRSDILNGFDGLLKVCLLMIHDPLQVCIVLLALVETALQICQGRIFLLQQVLQLGKLGA